MIGKVFLLLTVATVCLAQSPAGSLEEIVRKGIERAGYIKENGERRIDAAYKEVDYKEKLIQSKTADFVERAQRVQEDVRRALSSVAEAMREKARETKKPQSVFECIDRVEENANKNVESLTQKYAGDMKRLERVKLENIATYAKPLETMRGALKERYRKAVGIISNCKNQQCVDIALRSFTSWLDLLSTEISRIRSQVNTAVNNFQRDASTLTGNLNRQVSRIRSTAPRNIRQCIFNRDAFLEEFPAL